MIFLDSSVIIAYKNADDTNHKKAVNIFQKLNAGEYGIGVISEFVFSEVTTALALRKSMEAAKEVGNVLLEAREIEIMKASEVFERTWDIFTHQENTALSFVDASNLACMEKRGIRKIATFDRDFLRIKTVEVVNGLI
ncbi:MAG: PIN domain-containing protein [Candidatus Methanoperedens sp.]|nr:PIN domain-containing protein [Candidatus Methanoperedens sp.]